MYLHFYTHQAYVDQNSDLHSPYMTAGEVLHFSAELRLSRRVQPETRQAFVRDVLELLELESIRDCVVGPPGAGLSFEELKRLSIGAEVVAKCVHVKERKRGACPLLPTRASKIQ